MNQPGNDPNFPSTRWALVDRLRAGNEEEARIAREDLCAQYHYPLYCYIRRRGLGHHDAQDVLHDFLAKLLRLGVFEQADESKGRLRAFLSAALQRFLANWHRDNSRHRNDVSLDLGLDSATIEKRFLRENFPDADTPAQVFERKWCAELLGRVLRQLEKRYAGKGKSALFNVLRPVLLAGGSLRGEDVAAIATEASMTPGSLRVALSRLLHDYRHLLEHEVGQTVATAADVGDEIRFLQHCVSKE